MPKSPFQRGAQEGLNQPDSSSSVGGKSKPKRKRKSKPTSKTRAQKQSTRERYAKAREDAQLQGIIPTSPEGAIRPEQVPPSAQGEQVIPQLIAQAIRKGWSVPEGIKPELVNEMIRVIVDPYAKTKDKVAAFNALRMADRSQWEQDNPVDAGKAKGATSSVAVAVQSNVLAVQMIREALERDDGRGESALPPPLEPSGIGDSRFDGEVETGAASTED